MHGLWKRPVKAEHWEGSMLDAWVTFFRTLMSTAPAIQGSETDVQDNSQGWLVRCDSQWVVHHLGRLLTSSGPIPSLILEGCDWTGLFMFSDHVSFVDSSPFSLFLRQLLCSRCNLFNLSRSYMVDRGYGKLFRPRPLPQEKIALFFFRGIQLACVFGTHSGIQQDSHIVAASYYNTPTSRSTTVCLSFPDVVLCRQLYRKHCEKQQIPSKTRL